MNSKIFPNIYAIPKFEYYSQVKGVIIYLTL